MPKIYTYKSMKALLRQQQAGLFQELRRPVKQGLVPAGKTKGAVQRGALVDDLKGVGILLESLFRLRKPLPILAAAVFLQALHGGFQAVVLDLLAQQHVHRGIEKVSHPNNHILLLSVRVMEITG